MNKEPLGKLVSIDPREYWKNEATEFTPWLAQEENIALLGETLSLELELVNVEKEVGPYRADILCKDTLSGRYVLIENQLEKTNHSHLGQILTYAAGLDAVTIIWIAAKFTQEHRAAVDWLNTISEKEFNFFAIEIELWQIGSSSMAPKFNIVSSPNEWSKTIREIAVTSGKTLSETQKAQSEFFSAFIEYMEKNSHIKFNHRKPGNVVRYSLGRRGFYLAAITSTWDYVNNENNNILRVQFAISNDDSEKYFYLVEQQNQHIESQIGEKLFWHNQNGIKRKRIYIQKPYDFMDRNQWKDQFKWLKEKLELFHGVFLPMVKELNAEDAELLEEDEG